MNRNAFANEKLCTNDVKNGQEVALVGYKIFDAYKIFKTASG
jgi:hypothetical protein